MYVVVVVVLCYIVVRCIIILFCIPEANDSLNSFQILFQYHGFVFCFPAIRTLKHHFCFGGAKLNGL
jgi:hypothetical protein